jgi:hypothetical protein
MGLWATSRSALTTNGNQQEIKHGISVMATGGSPFQPTEYEYGERSAHNDQLGVGQEDLWRMIPNWQQPKQLCLFSA